LLDRPIVRIHIDRLIESTNINPDYVDIMSSVSMTITRPDQVVRAVEASLSDPTSKSLDRKVVATELFYDPGSATARAVGELYDAIELDPLASASNDR